MLAWQHYGFNTYADYWLSRKKEKKTCSKVTHKLELKKLDLKNL